MIPFDKPLPSGYGTDMIKLFVSLITFSLLASCAAGPPRMSREVIDRVLADAPGAAQPGKIVARELEFSRAAKEDGQWTAFRAFMAPGAVIHGRNGPIDAGQWLAAQSDPPEAVQWSARSVWMSCDGRLAVSRGRFRDPDGMVGTFVTVWEQQDDRSYKWIYDSSAPDDPQPAPQTNPDDGSIIVSADEIIQGYVADCPRDMASMPKPTLSVLADDTRTSGGTSSDGTLQWRSEHEADGTRRLYAQYLADGVWRTALSQTFPPRGEQ